MKEKSRKKDKERLLFLEKKIGILELLSATDIFFGILFYVVLFFLAWLLRGGEPFTNLIFVIQLVIIILISFSIVFILYEHFKKCLNKKIQKLEKEYNELFWEIKKKELFSNNAKIYLRNDSTIKEKILDDLIKNIHFQIIEKDNGKYEFLATAKIDRIFEFNFENIHEILENVEIIENKQ